MTDQPITDFPVESLQSIASAHTLLLDYERFLLSRFAAYTNFTEVKSQGGVAIDPISDPFVRTNSGYGYFRMSPNWVSNLAAVTTHYDRDTTGGAVIVEHVMDDDRGPSIVRKYVMPLSFVFGDDERESERDEFLRLKSIYEPGDTAETADSAPSVLSVAASVLAAAAKPAPSGWEGVTDPVSKTPTAEAETLDLDDSGYAHQKERQAAARTLLTHNTTDHHITNMPFQEQIVHLADPANRDDAAAAYRRAITSLVDRQPAHEAARRKVHAAALTLGLNAHDLRVLTVAAPKHLSTDDAPTSTYAAVKERQAAARVLLVESEGSNRIQSTFFHERVASLADPENREDAAEAYRLALTRLLAPGMQGTSKARGRVHEAAATLGLTGDDLRSDGSASAKASASDEPAADSPTTDKPKANKPKADKTPTDLGATIINDLTERFLGTGGKTSSPDMARRAYEKGRAVLTLSGKDVLGDHTDEVIAVLDDVADLLGLRKR